MDDSSEISFDFNFWKRIIFIFVFFTITPVALFSSVLSLITVTKDNNQIIQNNLIIDPKPGVKVYASLPSDNSFISNEVVIQDARPLILKDLLMSYNSPLSEYSELLVKTSDKYGFDWKILTAIALKESGACRVIPENSHNCWGWGIHSEGTLMFDNYEEAIETVSKGLKQNYIDKGYVSVEDIMKKYANPNSTTWADGVNYYIEKLK